MTRWRADDALALLAGERMTTVAGVPAQLALMLRQPDFDAYDLDSVALSSSPAAARSRPDLAEEARRPLRRRARRRGTRAPRPASGSAPRSTIPTRTRS